MKAVTDQRSEITKKTGLRLANMRPIGKKHKTRTL
jgi:hypothetical protein